MKSAILFILIAPGLACLYALAVRPLLHKITGLQKFYSEADGFWAKVWAVFGKSASVLWGYILGGIGAAFGLIDQIGPVIGDPSLNLKDQVAEALKNHPSLIAWIPVIVSVITIAARVRSMGKTP